MSFNKEFRSLGGSKWMFVELPIREAHKSTNLRLYSTPMMSQRIFRHVLFWGVFFSMSLFNVLYMSSSFSLNPGWDTFLRVTLSQLIIYTVKFFVVYYSLYSIIPRWTRSQAFNDSSSFSNYFISNRKSILKYFLEFIFVLLISTFFIRVLTHTVIWVHVFGEEHPSYGFSSLLARYIYSLFDIIPIVFSAIAIKLVLLRVKNLKHESKLVQEKLSTELLYLKAQTNPHFLFNTLNGIYALSRKQDPNTSNAIMNLSKILRYMLYQTSPPTNPIQDELQLISDYIELQKIRFQEHLTIQFKAAVDDGAVGISPLLLLPLVENAFKHSHGLDTQIEIATSLQDKKLVFSVRNNVSENMASDVLSEKGIGLSNIRRQLAILYKSYNLEVLPGDTNFEVILTIDLNTFLYA